MQQGVWPGSRLGQSGSAGGGAWLRPSQSGCSRECGLALPQPIQMQQRWGLGPGQSGCSRAPSQPIRMRQGVGPGPHWQARGLRAAFVRLRLFARAGVGAMASGLMSCLAARLGIAEPEVLRWVWRRRRGGEALPPGAPPAAADGDPQDGALVDGGNRVRGAARPEGSRDLGGSAEPPGGLCAAADTWPGAAGRRGGGAPCRPLSRQRPPRQVDGRVRRSPA